MPLKVGDRAPEFSLRDQHGQDQSVASRQGRRSLLIVFYPFAFTGVCTAEMKALSDHAASWDDLGADVIAVSCDPLASLRAFADQQGLGIPLLSDFWPHGEVARAYDAFEPLLGAAERATFVVDRQGAIRWTTRAAIADMRDVTGYLTALAGL